MASSQRVTRSTNNSKQGNTISADSPVVAVTTEAVTTPAASATGPSHSAKAVADTEAPTEEAIPVNAVNIDNVKPEGPQHTVAPAKKGKKKKGGKQPLKRVALTADQQALLNVLLNLFPYLHDF